MNESNSRLVSTSNEHFVVRNVWLAAHLQAQGRHRRVFTRLRGGVAAFERSAQLDEDVAVFMAWAERLRNENPSAK